MHTPTLGQAPHPGPPSQEQNPGAEPDRPKLPAGEGPWRWGGGEAGQARQGHSKAEQGGSGEREAAPQSGRAGLGCSAGSLGLGVLTGGGMSGILMAGSLSPSDGRRGGSEAPGGSGHSPRRQAQTLMLVIGLGTGDEVRGGSSRKGEAGLPEAPWGGAAGLDALPGAAVEGPAEPERSSGGDRRGVKGGGGPALALYRDAAQGRRAGDNPGRERRGGGWQTWAEQQICPRVPSPLSSFGVLGQTQGRTL